MKRKFFLLALTGALAMVFSPQTGYGQQWVGHQNVPVGSAYQEPATERVVPARVEFKTTLDVWPGAGPLVPHTSSRKAVPHDGTLRSFNAVNLYMAMEVKNGHEEGYYSGTAWFRDCGMQTDEKGERYHLWTVAYIDRCVNRAWGAEAWEYPERIERVKHSQTVIRERETVMQPVLVPHPYPIVQPYPVYGPVVCGPPICIDPAWAVASIITDAIFGPPWRHHHPRWHYPPPRHHHPHWYQPRHHPRSHWPQPRGPFCPNGWNDRR